MLVDHPSEAFQPKAGQQKYQFMYRNLVILSRHSLDKEINSGEVQQPSSPRRPYTELRTLNQVLRESKETAEEI